MIEPGDLVIVRFPTEEGGELLHPALVLTIEDTISGCLYAHVAYGSSKKVSASGHLDHEFVITDPEELRLSGLHKATRFDFRTTTRTRAERLRPIGKVDLNSRAVLRRLKAALMAAQ